MISVTSPLSTDFAFKRGGKKFVLKANATTKLPLVAAAYAVKILGFKSVAIVTHPNVVEKAAKAARLAARKK